MPARPRNRIRDAAEGSSASSRICSSSCEARNGDQTALDALIRRYTGFVRLKASSYFLAGGDVGRPDPGGADRPLQGGARLPPDKETSFRSFAELCVTRQIITAIKTATRFKHVAAEHVRLVQPHAGRPGVGRRLHARRRAARARRSTTRRCCVISTEELQSLVFCLGSGPLAARVRRAPPLPRGLLLRGDGRASSAATRRRSTTRSSG